MRPPTPADLRAYLTGGATTTSFPRGARLAVAAAICALPSYFAFKFLFNTSGPGAMACWLGVVLFAGPAVILLPALRHDPEHAGRDEVARRRQEREISAALNAGSEADAPASTWASRPSPPARW